MGYMQRLIGRVPLFFVLLGLVFFTGGYRSGELAGGSQPVTGLALVAVGVVAYGGLWYLRE